MDEFPPSTHKNKEQLQAEPPLPPEDPKKIEKVVANKVILRKKPLSSRMKQTFFGSDATSVWQYVMMDVFLPAAKDMIVDSVSQGIERMVFGESHHYGRRGGRARSRGDYGRVYTDYRRYSSSYRDERDRPPRPDRTRSLSRRERSNHDYKDIVLATRAEAEEVIDRLYDLIGRYDAATLADLYELLGIAGQFTDDKWGWVDLPRDNLIRRIRDGYLLDLPRPEPLD